MEPFTGYTPQVLAQTQIEQYLPDSQQFVSEIRADYLTFVISILGAIVSVRILWIFINKLS